MCGHKQLPLPCRQTNNPTYFAFGKYWMQARGLLNYGLKCCWLKVICCRCQSNELEREIKHKTEGTSRWPDKNVGDRGPSRPTLRTATGYKGANLLTHKLYAKTEAPFCLYLYSIKLFFAFFGSFGNVIFWWFRVLVYSNPQPNTFPFLNFFLNVGGDGPLSATFPTLAKTFSWATGLQINFPE